MLAEALTVIVTGATCDLGLWRPGTLALGRWGWIALVAVHDRTPLAPLSVREAGRFARP